MNNDSSSHSTDISFSVPFKHRLRVTDDIAGSDFDVLADLVRESNSNSRARILLVGEEAVSEHVTKLENQLRQCSDVDLVAPAELLAGGEAIKNNEHVLRMLLDRINDHGLDRRSYVVAVGGGAMLDAVGFATAIAHRGIRLIRLPSTVLAQADSGVGVKNAINYFAKKNWVGTFAVPWAVINDTSLLTTLPDRDYVSGFSEAVKVSLLKDSAEFDWLCDNATRIRNREISAAKHAIGRSCQLHLRHITEGGDPFESEEARPLDFGHWSAHRLEPLTQYKIRHGEAVGIGVAIDCMYSSIKFGFPESDALRVCECLSNLGIGLWHEAIRPIDRLMQGLEEFRQHLGGRLTITMLQGVGDPINVHEIDSDAMKIAIEKIEAIGVG
ncbi:3-dehydroquinate synthase [Rubripirellula obstinata]|uniref:3-dehydroquinate synthase n=2 Tax=Rubripirellula obstinata TaxID=406547 RepID=A0A5B1CE74_9BACT|nr:3-dehydroquinate synthase [Rubripirellula obstinata]KAA1258512.1 3-dehydroquinate synthase [Rubripirellula obstinata]